MDRLSGSKVLYSSYLSAATDRLPLRLLFHFLEDLFGRSFASAALNSCIACKVLSLPFGWGSQSVVSFVVGQPLVNASWPLFSEFRESKQARFNFPPITTAGHNSIRGKAMIVSCEPVKSSMKFFGPDNIEV